MPRSGLGLLIVLLAACGDSDGKADAAVDVRPVDAPADIPLGGDVPPGSCPAAGINCSPFLCRNGTCLNSCSAESDCVASATCQNGSCRNVTSLSCTSAAQCASGFCEQGVCCERACRSPCESCAQPASRGTCRPVPADAGCSQDAGTD